MFSLSKITDGWLWSWGDCLSPGRDKRGLWATDFGNLPVRLPTSAERFIKRNVLNDYRFLCDGLFVLQAIELTLGIEHV